MDYNVNVQTAGTYLIQYRVASTATTGQIQLRRGSTTLATTNVPNTGGWQNWTTITALVSLQTGNQTLRVHASEGGFNFNWSNFSQQSDNINIAYNRPVTTSSNQSTTNAGAKAVDANGTTRWESTFTDNQFIIVDLGANYNVNRVRIAWESAYARDYQIQFSTNNSTWTTVGERWGKTSAAAENHTGLSGTARYVKVYCINRATSWGFSMFELEVYGTGVTLTTSVNDSNYETNLSISNNSIVESTDSGIVIFPNPVENNVMVNVPKELVGGKIVMMNSGGIVVFTSKATHQNSFSMSKLPTGLYLLNISNGVKNINAKILKK